MIYFTKFNIFEIPFSFKNDTLSTLHRAYFKSLFSLERLEIPSKCPENLQSPIRSSNHRFLNTISIIRAQRVRIPSTYVVLNACSIDVISAPARHLHIYTSSVGTGVALAFSRFRALSDECECISSGRVDLFFHIFLISCRRFVLRFALQTDTASVGRLIRISLMFFF